MTKRIIITQGGERVSQRLKARGFNPDVAVQIERVAKATGGLVIPALRDTHTHPAIFGILFGVTNPVFLGECIDKQKVLEMVEARAKEQKNVFGFGFARLSGVTRQDLDVIAKKYDCDCICLVETSFHAGMVNTKFAEEMKQKTKGKKGVHGEVKENGMITEGYTLVAIGLLEERFIDKAVDGVERYLIDQMKAGTTSLDEKLIISITEAVVLKEAVKRVKERYGYNPIRSVCLSHDLFMSYPEILNILRDAAPLVGIKWVNDGGTKNATLRNYTFADGSKGDPHMIPIRGEEAETYAKRMLDHGVTYLEWHSIGDGTTKDLLAMAPTFLEAGIKVSMSHLNLAEIRDIERVLYLGIPISMQPPYTTEAWRPDYAKVLGKLAAHNNPINSAILAASDIRKPASLITFGTDGMPPSMLFAVLCAKSGNIYQSIDIKSAVWHSQDEGTIMVVSPEAAKHLMRESSEVTAQLQLIIDMGQMDQTADWFNKQALIVANKERVLYSRE